MADTRISQTALEALEAPAPDVRVSGRVAEVLGTSVAVLTTAGAVTQAAAEVLSLAIVPAVVTHAPIEVLYQAGGRWKLFLDGADTTAAVASFSFRQSLNERGTASIVLHNVLTHKFTEVVSTAKNGFTPLFGGVILTRSYDGANLHDPDYSVTCDCGDWFTYADWASISHVYDVPVTVKQVLQDLIVEALGAYGITLHPLQVDGPALEPFVWRQQRVSDAIRELSDRTGLVAQITPAKQLRMFVPGTDAAPVAVTEASPQLQELRWNDRDRAGGIPANKVTIVAGPTGTREIHDERHYGDGVTRIFPLYSPFVAVIGALTLYPYNEPPPVGVGAGGFPLGICGEDIDPDTGGDMKYCYLRDQNAVKQRDDQPVLLEGEYFWLWYFAEFPFAVSAWTGETPVIEITEVRPDVLSIPAAQSIANQILASFGGGLGAESRELDMQTDLDGFEVGQRLSVDLPVLRSVAGEFVISDLSMTIVLDPDVDGPGEPYWEYRLNATEAASGYQGSYLDEWRRLSVDPSTVTAIEAPATQRARHELRVPKPEESVGRSRYIYSYVVPLRGPLEATLLPAVPPADPDPDPSAT